MTTPVDQIIHARWIAPVAPTDVVLEDHALVLRDGLIIALLPGAEATARYPAAIRTELPHHLLTPGLINLHTHAAMTLLRGAGDDLPLETWLHRRIWPLEKALMSADFVRDGTRLACLEMLRGGVTCFNDMYFFPEAAAQAALETGMRAALGITVIDFPTVYASDADDYLAKGLAARDALREEPLISFTLAPHAVYTVKDATFTQIGILAEQINLPVHVHLHETRTEISEELARSGMRPLERLRSLGLVGPNLIAVHAVHLEAHEIALLATCGATLAHCPSANLKLASGIAPIAECLRAGLRVGIGTDSAASNNRLDVLGEMRLAALLAKGTSGRADVFGAHQVLRAATLDAATALGLEARIGSLEAGKAADLAAFDLGQFENQPCHDPVIQLIYSADRSNVSDVWVAGKHVVRKRQPPSAAQLDLEQRARHSLAVWQERIRSTLSALDLP